MIIEFFSTGMLSFTYADLKRQDRKRIARAAFNTGDQQLESWLRAFTELRNKCAHYTRLYFGVLPLYLASLEIAVGKWTTAFFRSSTCCPGCIPISIAGEKRLAD
ncbi:Abi family protein [Mobiluncus mulieris]|nr:Abi family protein [Mobiluncus mulieris]